MAAKEQIEFKGYTVSIRRRAYQKRLALSVYPSGEIRVSANKSLKTKEIYKFLEKQKNWIEKSVEDSRGLRLKYPPKKFQDGETYPFLGKDYELRIQSGDKLSLKFVQDYLYFTVPYPKESLTEERCKSLLELFKKSYRKVAETLMSERIELHSQKMGLEPKSLHFRNQKSIWGSCSGDNKISINFKLIVAPLEVIDYVLIHELAHIKHKNHSKRFWALVEAYTPHRHFSKDWLKNNQYKTDFLSKHSELHL